MGLVCRMFPRHLDRKRLEPGLPGGGGGAGRPLVLRVISTTNPPPLLGTMGSIASVSMIFLKKVSIIRSLLVIEQWE